MGCTTSQPLELFVNVSSCGRRRGRKRSTNTNYKVVGLILWLTIVSTRKVQSTN
jgi:hypothetical protein